MDKRFFYQWDLDRRIELPDVPLGTEVHFYSPYIEEKDGLKVYSKEENGVVVADVPNIILQYAGSFQVYVWPYYTVMYAEYMVIERPKPAGYIYKETEVIYTIEDAVNRGLEKAKESGMFDGAKGDPGKDGKDGKDGIDGKDGKTPYIQNGYWFIGGVNTNIKAEGRDGSDGEDGKNGLDGKTPYIQNGYWYINGINTSVKAEGRDGANGKDGAAGKDGSTPYIEGGYWYINGVNTGVKAEGKDYVLTDSDREGIAGSVRDELEDVVGDIDSVLDSIIELQKTVIGEV